MTTTASSPRMLRPRVAKLALVGLVCGGCSVGQGEGSVTSPELYVDNCYRGPFNLRPTFFAANPFGGSLTIRVQRGEEEVSVSDGFAMLVYDVATVRLSMLGVPLRIALPVGVSPLGYPLPEVPDPPGATLTLYLNNSCRGQNAQLSAVDGTVQFTKLFSGDPNEENAEDRLTEGSFQAFVVDPRHAMPRPAGESGPAYFYPEEYVSEINGDFSFVFHRGTPAQPFP
jgi:hypothetical protein